MPTGYDIANTALLCRGDRYTWGANPATTTADPTAEDCSGLTSWAHRHNGVPLTAGTWLQAEWLLAHGTVISIDEAIATPGALVYYFSSNVWRQGRRPSESHVVISLGNRLHEDIEAHNTRQGVGVYGMDTVHWTIAFLHPSVSYATQSPEPPTPPPTATLPVPPAQPTQPTAPSEDPDVFFIMVNPHNTIEHWKCNGIHRWGVANPDQEGGLQVINGAQHGPNIGPFPVEPAFFDSFPVGL